MNKHKFITKIKDFFLIRLHMTFIVLGTWGIGFLTNKILFINEIHSLLIRYPITLIVSYLTFLFLIRVWLFYIFGYDGNKNSIDHSSNAVDTIDLFSNLRLKGGVEPSSWIGQGGTFSGGGSQGSWGSGDGKVSLDSLDIGDDFGAVVIGALIVLMIFTTIIFSTLLIINAPSFLGELAIEMALSIGLVKNMKKKEGNWLFHAFKKTWIGFVITLIVFIAFAFFAQQFFPGIYKLQDIINEIRLIIFSL
jgi:hypothetical protein